MKAKILITGVLLLAATGCTRTMKQGDTVTVVVREPVNELEREPVPGTVNDVWVEPMVDNIWQPGQLNPSGTYYRQGNHTLVEIRPGRYQKVEYPADEAPRSR